MPGRPALVNARICSTAPWLAPHGSPGPSRHQARAGERPRQTPLAGLAQPEGCGRVPTVSPGSAGSNHRVISKKLPSRPRQQEQEALVKALAQTRHTEPPQPPPQQAKSTQTRAMQSGPAFPGGPEHSRGRARSHPPGRSPAPTAHLHWDPQSSHTATAVFLPGQQVPLIPPPGTSAEMHRPRKRACQTQGPSPGSLGDPYTGDAPAAPSLR